VKSPGTIGCCKCCRFETRNTLPSKAVLE